MGENSAKKSCVATKGQSIGRNLPGAASAQGQLTAPSEEGLVWPLGAWVRILYQ